MTRNRDIERVLDRWFVEGSSAMPDRVLAAVFDQVDQTPQRRLLALLPRSLTMSPSLRLGLAAAALAAVVLAGLTLFRPPAGPGASPSPTIKPTPSPTVLAGATPDALLGRWMGGPRAVNGIAALSGTSLLFEPASVAISPANQNGEPHLDSGVAADAGTLAVVSSTAVGGCAQGDAGTFSWAISTGGSVLTLTSTGDACPARAAAFAGTWWKMACPTADDNCLGPLEPGTYASQFIDPFIPLVASWQAIYGRFSYTVPAGWSNVADWPGELTLAPTGGPSDAGIFIWNDAVIVSEEDMCTEVPATNVDRTAQAMADWLASAPGLATTTPEAVTIGGVSGFRLDVAMDPSWTQTCPFSAGNPTRMIFTDTPAESGFHWGVSGDGQMRLFLFDTGERVLVVDIEAATQANFDAMADEATIIVESFQFNP